MILAHGFGTDQTAWHFQVSAFAPNYRLILFDLMGAGRSDMSAFDPARYTGFEAYADDVLEICAALDLHGAIYVGHSMSGMIGLLAARAAPARFAHMICIGASPRYLNDEGYLGGFTQIDLDALYAAMTADYHAWADVFAPMVMGMPDRPELAKAFARTMAALPPATAHAVARIIFQSDYRQVLPEVPTPTLLLQADADMAVPLDVAQYLEQHLPKARLQVINACGHLPHVSAPGAVNQAIQAYLAAAG
jgi:sigma-B regulation protein RsbQ